MIPLSFPSSGPAPLLNPDWVGRENRFPAGRVRRWQALFGRRRRILRTKPMRKKSVFLEYVEVLLIALLLALIIRTFAVQAYRIPSGSMLETLQIGDQLLVNRLAYGLFAPFKDDPLVSWSAPQRGDIIVFEYPLDPEVDFIKRVIGVPGDKIVMENKVLYVNGVKMNEPYAQHIDPDTRPRRDNFGPIEVPPGKYFVMGDNRDDSQDSRFWGFVGFNAIQGKAVIIYWSWFDWHVKWDRVGKLVH